jgi:hypothetical protein
MFVKCANEERDRVPVGQFVCPACGECATFTLSIKLSILLASCLASSFHWTLSTRHSGTELQSVAVLYLYYAVEHISVRLVA